MEHRRSKSSMKHDFRGGMTHLRMFSPLSSRSRHVCYKRMMIAQYISNLLLGVLLSWLSNVRPGPARCISISIIKVADVERYTCYYLEYRCSRVFEVSISIGRIHMSSWPSGTNSIHTAYPGTPSQTHAQERTFFHA